MTRAALNQELEKIVRELRDVIRAAVKGGVHPSLVTHYKNRIASLLPPGPPKG